MHLIDDANAVLAFLLELAVYAAVTWWGFTRTRHPLPRIALALGALALFILAWSLFGAPHATHPLHGPTRIPLELTWYGTAAAAISTTRGPRPTLWFLAAYALSTTVHLL